MRETNSYLNLFIISHLSHIGFQPRRRFGGTLGRLCGGRRAAKVPTVLVRDVEGLRLGVDHRPGVSHKVDHAGSVSIPVFDYHPCVGPYCLNDHGPTYSNNSRAADSTPASFHCTLYLWGA